MASPGVSVRPIKLLDGECEINEVWFNNVKVSAENLIAEENQGWTYAKHLLSHERTSFADVSRAKRELERLQRIAKTEGVWDDSRFRDQIALLEVDLVALEMLAAEPFCLPLIQEAMDAGWQGDLPGGELANAPLASNHFNMRKTAIYGGSKEVQRNLVAQTVLG